MRLGLGLKTTSAFAVGSLLMLGGCAFRVGPKTVPLDRFDYSQSLSRSWQQQMLLNLVRVRYLDAPFFLDVSQVVAQYSLTVGASGSSGTFQNFATSVGGGIDGHWVESPKSSIIKLFVLNNLDISFDRFL